RPTGTAAGERSGASGELGRARRTPLPSPLVGLLRNRAARALPLAPQRGERVVRTAGPNRVRGTCIWFDHIRADSKICPSPDSPTTSARHPLPASGERESAPADLFSHQSHKGRGETEYAADANRTARVRDPPP